MSSPLAYTGARGAVYTVFLLFRYLRCALDCGLWSLLAAGEAWTATLLGEAFNEAVWEMLCKYSCRWGEWWVANGQGRDLCSWRTTARNRINTTYGTNEYGLKEEHSIMLWSWFTEAAATKVASAPEGWWRFKQATASILTVQNNHE